MDGRKRRQVSKAGFPTRKAAEAALSEFIGQTSHGEVVTAGGRQTVNEYLDEWLVGMRLTLAVSAWTNYRSIVDLYVRPRIGRHRLTALTGPALTALYGGLLAEGGRKQQAAVPDHRAPGPPGVEQGID
ncbi:MAG: hypothetical protein H0T85_04710 [Geodermatophilaceae bacterium]|nr:hypothetical protein [Geodermatophilaceae bacterium]